MTFPYDESIGLKHVGYECIGDKFLSAEMQASGKRRKCAYCGKSAKGYRIMDIAERVDKAFETFYTPTANAMTSLEERLFNDRESQFEFERKGDPAMYAIADALSTENEIAEDIRQALDNKYCNWDPSDPQEETEFDEESHYARIGANDEIWQIDWKKFVKSLKSENRYFNHEGAIHLRKVFAGIHDMNTYDKRAEVRDIGPNTSISNIFRARVFQSDEKLKEALKRPELQLGPPPSAFASNGRMNARGISVFYGALHESTALAEVRPPVGSQVMVGDFSIVRPLKVLDLTALEDVSKNGSIFDPAYAGELERITFLGNLTAMLTKPVMPDDEVFEYLPTQAIADFLATEPDFKFDGIIFPSAQVVGKLPNMVLFNKASRVDETPLSKRVVSHVQLWDFDVDAEKEYRSYTVYEREEEPVPETEPNIREDLPPLAPGSLYIYPYNPNTDERQVSLKLIIESVGVYTINAVQIKAEAHSVQRHHFSFKELNDE